MLKKLLGKKKNQDYFLEFEGKNKNSKPAQESVKEPVKGSAQESPSVEGSETSQPTVSQPTQPKSNVSYDPPEWVKAIKNYSSQNNGSSSAENSLFAGKYVTNNVPMSRRRPGPSLNKFKKIASQIDA